LGKWIETTTGGTLNAQTEYTPFGSGYDGVTSNCCDYTFNGGSHADTFGGLYDTVNRELQPVQGRWIQPDPSGLSAVDITNPQSWNRYAYVNNNPLSNVDPTGLDCIYLNDDNSVNHVKTGGNADCDSSTDDGYYVDGTIVGGANGVSVSEDGNWLAYTIQGNDFASGMCIGDCGFSTTVSSTFSSTDVLTLQARQTTTTIGPTPLGPTQRTPGQQLKPGCTGPALLAGAKAAGMDLIPVPPEINPDPVGATGDLATSKQGQAATIAVLYQAANAARFLAPAADVAADFVPVAGQIWLGYQVGHALYEGGKVFKESVDQCYGGG
jgi:RHS repeat-associated protein